ncbi:hypothetical protein Tco_1231857 [Tanacetum coccineum]
MSKIVNLGYDHIEVDNEMASEDDDGVLDKLSLELRFNVKKVMCGLMYGRGSPDDGNVVLCVCKYLSRIPSSINFEPRRLK